MISKSFVVRVLFKRPSQIPVTDAIPAIVNSLVPTAVTLLKVGTVPDCWGYLTISPTLTKDLKSLMLVEVTFPVV